MSNRFFLVLLIAFFLNSVNLLSQEVNTVNIPGETIYCWKNQQGKYSGGNGKLKAGKDNYIYRSYIKWNNIRNVSPIDFSNSQFSFYKGVFLNQVPDPNNPNKPYYSVKADAVQDIPLQQTGRTHKFYFQNWSASPQGSAEFQDANALETPVVFKQEGATVQANLKGTQLSNNSNAYSKGSQRKFV